ncbi:MAG: hypothetical protein H6672_10480 [Anaerolineaceae bacterium]|nr:hypothetical protein [Anaerolineaceae bacterium]
MFKKLTVGLFFCLVLLIGFSATLVEAGDLVLTDNSGTESSIWYVTGEQTLVMNGFDLTPLGLQLPAQIDRVSIAVDAAVPGTLIDVVVYQDGNGGSPVDATLIGQKQVDILQAGVYTVVFDTPIQVTQPVVWVGFYLPVNFKFLADKSGSSVLTYWAWTPGARFDLSQLSSATVFGPADGSAPVNLNMNGIARITAEISSVSGDTTVVTPSIDPATGLITQVSAPVPAQFSVMRRYAGCETLEWDTADVDITLKDSIDLICKEIWPGFAPASPAGYARQQLLYDVTIYTDEGPFAGELPAAVTHCIEPNPADIDRAVVGVAFGTPRQWEILPTVRFGNVVCAEVTHGGGLSYFIPGG